MNMLTTSYVTASVAMVLATFYLFVRLRLFLTTATFLIVGLLLIDGPAFISFTLSSGEPGFLLRLLSGTETWPVHPHPIFAIISSKVPDLNPVITAMNFSIAIMYLGIIAGMELTTKLMPARSAITQIALKNWSTQNLKDELTNHRVLLAVIVLVFLAMLFVSIRENHIGTIWRFFSISGDNEARNLFRARFGSSPNYPYRVVLGAIAPMLVIWGLLSGIVRRSWPLLLASCLLLCVVMIGNFEVLSKAPIAFPIFQLLLAAILTVTNRISSRIVLIGGLAACLVIYAVVSLVMIFPEGASPLVAAYVRVFESESQSLLENFAFFPALHPFMWGTNLRPIAMLLGVPFKPSYSMVAYAWYGNYGVTSPTLFIADAWADFSYAGVLVASIVAGAVCRSIDLIFLARGKSVAAIAVLCATVWGIVVLMTTALNTALLSGGLLLAPAIAALIAPKSALNTSLFNSGRNYALRVLHRFPNAAEPSLTENNRDERTREY